MSTYPDRSEVAKNWHARGFSCGMWIDHAGREWSYQAQASDELFMMISGKLELEMEGRSLCPGSGEEICIPAGMPYTIRNIGGKTACWLYGQQGEAVVAQPVSPNAPLEYLEPPEVRRKRRPINTTSAVQVSKSS